MSNTFPGEMRVGIGYDSHKLGPGRPLMLGGVEIPHDAGLIGHSDADVCLHAIIDALLGACGLPDIGECFPNTDPAYAGADSSKLLVSALERVREAGFAPHNVDCVIHAERPKLSAFKRPIADKIADLLGIPRDRACVKAKTGEGLGMIGSGQAMACMAVATVYRMQ